MKKWLIILAVVLAYLNRAYGVLYDSIGRFDLPAPTQATITLGHGKNLTYVALGDSLTAGVGVDNFTQAYPYLYAQKLAIGSQVTYINLAEKGATTESLIKNELPKLKDLHPDLITLLIGINDLHDFKSVSVFKANYSLIVQDLQKTGAKIVVLNIPNLGDSSILWPPFNYLYDVRTKQYNTAIESLGLKVVDFYSVSQNFNKTMYSLDKFHPSAVGYKIWSDTLNAN